MSAARKPRGKSARESMLAEEGELRRVVPWLDFYTSEFNAQITGSPNAKGWAPCYSLFRDEDKPSAAINASSGRYKDSGDLDDDKAINAWEVGARPKFGKWADFKAGKKAIAERFGVTLTSAKSRRKGNREYENWRTALRPQDWTLTGKSGRTYHGPTDRVRGFLSKFKPGISVEAVQAFGGWIAKYKCDQTKKDENDNEIAGEFNEPKWDVIALPVFNATGSEPTAQVILSLNPTGKPLTVWNNETKSPDEIKIKSVGSTDGFIIWGRDRIAAHRLDPQANPIDCVWWVEGPTDALALYTAMADDDVRARNPIIARTGGATQFNPWMGDYLRDLPVSVIGDSDKAGILGAEKSARGIAAKSSAPVKLFAPLFEPIEEKHGLDLRDWFNAGNRFAQLRSHPSTTIDVKTIDPLGLGREENRTEVALSGKFADAHRGRILWLDARGKWLYWDGRRFREDEERRVEQYAKAFAVDIWAKVAAVPSDDHLAATLTYLANKMNTATGIRNLLSLSRSESGIASTPGELDQDPWLFTGQNGTVDLRTGEILPHNPAHRITKLANVVFDKAADCPLWRRTVSQIYGGDESLIRHVQEVLGYSLTGIVREHKLFIFYGGGANGKSTLLELFSYLMGDYAMAAVSDLLLAKKESHPAEVAMLHGKRWVTCSETDDGRRLAEARVKQLTSGDPITARGMCENPWQFWPSAKLGLMTNHRPQLLGTDEGIRRRLNLIPHNVTFAPEQRDKRLGEKLRGELSGIFNWCLEGCLRWQRQGLSTPPAVADATTDYIESQDVLGRFLDERCERNEAVSVFASAIYVNYKAWAEANGERAMTMRRFGQSIAERGFSKTKRAAGFYYDGLTLKPQTSAPQTEEVENSQNEFQYGDAWEGEPIT